MSPKTSSLLKFALVLVLLCTSAPRAFAQSAPSSSGGGLTLATIEHWYLICSTIGSAASVFIAVIAAQFPSITWISKLGVILGGLPVLDIHGLTTGTMQQRLAAAHASSPAPGAASAAPSSGAL